MHKNEILPISKVGFSIPWEDIECLCCVLGQYLIFFIIPRGNLVLILDPGNCIAQILPVSSP